LAGVVWLPIEVKPWGMAEFQRADGAVSPTPDDYQRRHEPGDLEVPSQLLGRPDLPILGLQLLARLGAGVDLAQPLAAGRFGRIGHDGLLSEACSVTSRC